MISTMFRTSRCGGPPGEPPGAIWEVFWSLERSRFGLRFSHLLMPMGTFFLFGFQLCAGYVPHRVSPCTILSTLSLGGCSNTWRLPSSISSPPEAEVLSGNPALINPPTNLSTISKHANRDMAIFVKVQENIPCSLLVDGYHGCVSCLFANVLPTEDSGRFGVPRRGDAGGEDSHPRNARQSI